MKTGFKNRFGVTTEELALLTNISFEKIYDLISGNADIQTYTSEELERIETVLDVTKSDFCSYIVEQSGLTRTMTFKDRKQNDETCIAYVYEEDDCYYIGLNIAEDQYEFCLCKATGDNAVSICSSIDELFDYYSDIVVKIYE